MANEGKNEGKKEEVKEKKEVFRKEALIRASIKLGVKPIPKHLQE